MTESCESCAANDLAGTRVQAKLVVGPVNDPYEQEADRVADQVMRMPDEQVATTSDNDPGPVIQRACASCEEDEEKLQRQPEEDEEESIQAKREAGPSGGEVSAKQTAEIESIKTGGEPLHPANRSFFEQRFGHDFSNVRIHSDDRASQSAKGINAQAYTTGQHIIFGAGHYSPNTQAGQKLLAHELTHVIQQDGDAHRHIQRSATFTPGKPTDVINPAQQIGENKIPADKLFLGETNFMLNGKSFTDAPPDDVKAALKKPKISSTPTTLPVGQNKTAPAVECQIDSVDDNKGTNEIKLLSKDTWKFVTDKTNVGKRFPSLKACANGFGQVTFVVRGDPSDDKVRDRVRAHENQHADDNEAAFKTHLVAWDKAITDLKTNQIKVKRPTLPLCKAGLYAYGGKDNDPDNVAIRLAQEIVTKNNDFHSKPAGAKPDTKPDPPQGDCTNQTAQIGYNQGSAAQAPAQKTPLLSTPADLTANARYPTADERKEVKEIFDPQQAAAEESGSATVEAVKEPDKFRTEMKDCMKDYIDLALPGAKERESSSVSLDLPMVQGMADVAQAEVEKFFKPYLKAAVNSPDEQKRVDKFKLKDEIHMVSEKHPEATEIACNWLSSRMVDVCGSKLGDFNVMASVIKAKQSCAPASSSSTTTTTTATPGERDQALFQSVRDEILADRKSDLETIVKFQSSFEASGESFIQGKIKAEKKDTGNMTLRRGRWQAFGTIIHEMLHAIAHQKFREAIKGVENQGIGIEGFAEYFARIVYNDVRRRAEKNDALRTSIEGVTEPFDIDLAPDRIGGTYQKYVDAVEQIKTDIAGNEESLRVAYFMGRVEYIGLGGWNEKDAARNEELRHPANTLGFGALLIDGPRGLFTVNYARFIVGRGKPFQVGIGPQLYYLSPGEHKEGDVSVPEDHRLGVGARAMLQYSWPNFYIRGSFGAGASVTFDKPFEQSVRLDLIPGAEAGVRIGWARIGAGTQILIPVVGGPVGEKTVKAGGFLGVSADY